MARRIVNGNAFSEDGWPIVDQGSCTWVNILGTENGPQGTVRLQLQNGLPLIVLSAFAADFHVNIEPLRDNDSASWTPSNSVLGQPGRNNGSNHLGATGMDLNWDGPSEAPAFRYGITKERAYPGDKSRRLDELMDFWSPVIFCGGNWSNHDWMHFQCAAGTYDQRADRPTQKILDFIRDRIRPDGLSTYKRGGTPGLPVPPKPAEPTDASRAVSILSRATGVTAEKAGQILVGVVNGLRDSQCTNVNRIAMWLAQMGHESAGFNATEEYASGAAYEGRCSDLGNCSPGDGVRFKGRSWIQVTGRSNYAALSKWANGKGIVPTPTFFVDNPQSLALMQYAGLGPAWYWTVARADINTLSDKRDLVTVTRRINGGTNGLADRQSRYDRALTLGDQLLTLTTATAPQGDDDDMSAEAERMIREMYDEYRKEKEAPSRSFLATDGAPVESPLGFLYNIDGNVWSQQLTWAYLFDVPLAVDVVTSVARNGSYEGSWVKSNEFNAWLNEFGQAYCNGLISFKNALVGKLAPKAQTATVARVATENQAPPVTNVTNVVDTRALEAEIARLSDQFERLQVAVTNPPAPASTEVSTYVDSTGDKIQRAVDSSMDYTDHVLTLDAAKRTALVRALNSIDPSNGVQA